MWYNIGLFLLLASFVERLQSKRGVMDNHLHINLIIFLIEGKRKAYLWLTLSNFIWFLWVSLYFKKPTLKFFTTFFIFYYYQIPMMLAAHFLSSSTIFPFSVHLNSSKKRADKSWYTIHRTCVKCGTLSLCFVQIRIPTIRRFDWMTQIFTRYQIQFCLAAPDSFPDPNCRN